MQVWLLLNQQLEEQVYVQQILKLQGFRFSDRKRSLSAFVIQFRFTQYHVVGFFCIWKLLQIFRFYGNSERFIRESQPGIGSRHRNILGNSM